MTSDTLPPKSFYQSKLLLFKFLAHQIHPFAYAVNTFLQPALDDCRALLRSNPQDTFNILLSLTQTFLRFAPDPELIYDDIQQFAKKLKDTIDECLIWLDSDIIRQSSQLLESIQQKLLSIIQQEDSNKNMSYTNMYRNMSTMLTNLQKVQSLPVEMQSMSLNNTFDTTVSIQTIENHEIGTNTIGQSDLHKYDNILDTMSVKQTTTNSIPSSDVSLAQDENCFTVNLPSLKNQSELSSFQSKFVSFIPTSVTTKLVNQIKNPAVSSMSVSRTSSTISTSANQSSLKLITTESSSNENQITDTIISSSKKSMETVTAYPPHHNPTITNQQVLVSDKPDSTSIISENNKINGFEWNAQTPTPTSFKDDGIQFSASSSQPGTSDRSSIEDDDDEWYDEGALEYYLNPRFYDPILASAEWRPARSSLSIVTEKSYLDCTTRTSHSHVTDEYIQEFGNQLNCPDLRGDLFMTYGTPQNASKSTYLPIGVALSYDELTLLSCDVHRNSQNVRLFDIETGELKHTITSNKQMKFHRPSAVMSDIRNRIFIVERDYIHITEPDGRLIQKIGHPSIRQLYGIASFQDRYLLTMDSKASADETAENSRLLLFDSSNGQLVFEQHIGINRASEVILKQQSLSHIQGKILSETTSKPRFLAVHNDDVYVADLGRSLIYGARIQNEFELHCTTVFGGQGRANGELTDPSGLVIDSGGNVISADSKNDRIQIFSSTGEYRTTLKLNERIKRPSGICTNHTGTKLYVSCYLTGCIRAFNISY